MSLTREQVLLTLAVTALILLVVAQTWGWLVELSWLTLWHWDGLALVYGLLLGLGLNGLGWLGYALWPSFREASDSYLTLVLKPLRPADLIWLGLLPGLSEELLFRGVALTNVGLIASSVLFGLLHMLDLRYWSYALWALVVGLLLGFTMMETGNLLIPVVAHVVNNWLAAGIWYGRQR